MSDYNSPKISPLNESNYSTWSEDMQATLRGRGLWRLVSKQEKHHTSNPHKQEKLDDKADRACSVLILGVKPSQQVHFQMVKDNPIKICKALESAHVHKQPNTRFNTYDDFFSIRKDENKLSKPSWPTLMDQCIKCKTYVPTTSTSRSFLTRNSHAWQ